MKPYLEGELRADFDRWLEAAVARFVPPLTFSEVRKGVVALSSLYVERRERGVATQALAGQGKRAAFATCYAPLHFLAAWHALAGGAAGARRRVVDVGCGTGAAGAAAARRCGARRVLGVDRSGWALAEARRTYAAFGLAARLRRAPVPDTLPRRTGPDDLWVAGWLVNELPDGRRDALLERLLAARRAGAGVAVLEPLAGAALPWWDAWVERLGREGATARPVKERLALPAWIARLDRASGLSHVPVGARLLLAAGGAPPRRAGGSGS